MPSHTHDRPLMMTVASLGLMGLVGIYALSPTPIEAMHAEGFWTARVGTLLFLGTFIARPVSVFWKSPASRWLLSRRSTLGLCFAATMAIHLVFVLLLPAIAEEPGHTPPDAVTLLGGGIAYAFIAAMAVTSFGPTAAWLGQRSWRRLHRLGAWYIGAIFLFTWASDASLNPFQWIPALALVLAAVLRIAAARKIALS